MDSTIWFTVNCHSPVGMNDHIVTKRASMYLSLLCPHPPLVGRGWGLWGGFDLSGVPFGRALYGQLLLYIHTFVQYIFDERDCPCRSELALLKFPTTPHRLSYQPGKVGHKIDSCTSPSCTVHDAFQPTTSLQQLLSLCLQHWTKNKGMQSSCAGLGILTFLYIGLKRSKVKWPYNPIPTIYHAQYQCYWYWVWEREYIWHDVCTTQIKDSHTMMV